MFKFLKDKLQGAISKLAKKVETEAKEEVVEVEKAPESEIEKKKEKKEILEEKPSSGKKSFFQKLFSGRQKEDRKKIAVEVEDVKKDISGVAERISSVESKVEGSVERKTEAEKITEKKSEEQDRDKILRKVKQEIETQEIKEPVAEVSKEVKTEKTESGKKEDAKEESAKKEVREKAERPKIEPKKEKVAEARSEKQPEKKSFIGKIVEKIITRTISEQQFDGMFWELEVVMLENNVAVEVIEKIKEDLKSKFVNVPIPRNKVNETIIGSLRESVKDLFDVERIDLLERINSKKPFVIVFVGVNGSGKTTTIAKVARFCQKNNLSVVVAAGDTFRAAAIDQLEQHTSNLGVKLIKHDYGSDSAAVAFDAIKHAEASKKDVVLIDTAGRLHSNVNLMDEMKKIIRVSKPDLILFVGESITGNDCVEQAKKFDEAIGIDGIVLAKADVDEKGGAAISVSYVTKKPILYLGTGQGYNDLAEFDSKIVIEGLGL